jgi:hypothetical protein
MCHVDATLPVQYATLPVQYATLPVQYATLPVQYATLPVQYSLYVPRRVSEFPCKSRCSPHAGSRPSK